MAALLVENNQKVPDFLEEYKPAEDQALEAVFDDDSAGEEDDFNPAGETNGDAQGEADAWGAGEAAPAQAPQGDSWGNDTGAAPVNDAWGATVTSGGGAGW